jgi:hypothetical protein
MLVRWLDPGGWTRPYIKVRGSWAYLYRAVDKAGRTVDFFLSRNGDVTAVKTLLCKAMRNMHTHQNHAGCRCGIASRRPGNARNSANSILAPPSQRPHPHCDTSASPGSSQEARISGNHAARWKPIPLGFHQGASVNAVYRECAGDPPCATRGTSRASALPLHA